MAILINGTTCFDAWHNASTHLQNQPTGEETNMLIQIATPCDFADLSVWLRDRDPRKIHAGGDNIRHVINTIFPYKLESLHSNRQDFYQSYAKVYSKSTNKKWGTYFQRLTSYGKGINVGQTNQLENAIVALLGKSPQRFFITFHLTSANIESNIRPLGGPCWQYGEIIKNQQGNIDMVVVYRNQDYFNKALGNFIGLAKLLEFICKESNQKTGNLIVHSIHGYSSVGIPKLAQLTR